ncbi:4-cresol dehydrogenase (hydroxylating) [Micromonospora sp. Llam0]|uniref:FAD-binding oxidoreductase n=1 Tax=Micromonospora sp. Llam0 TaxID=2485143 RepID=UPI000FA765E7|nr:FAD-binding oxidoreductase [Micromonospora sp. Llam0]ROO62007.1 4-cresol dehydrogenase (hydroxylating) [Micromonospora sp. Llam0]
METEALADPDLGDHRRRHVRGTLFAGSTADVQDAVRTADRHGTALYPVSTGRNWGMGSRTPVTDGCTVLDLRHMTRIRTLDLDRGYAVIEPGVSQRELAQRLEGTPWMLNVTAGCADASFVGNTLERGDGTIRARSQDLLGLEVVLGTGELMTTGGLDRHGRLPGSVAGPDLTRAFVQSNLGVVTAMGVGLIPRPEAITLINATFTRPALGSAIDALTRIGRAAFAGTGLFRLKELFIVPESGSPALPETADPEVLTIQGPLLGSRAGVKAAEEGVRDIVAGADGLVSYRALDTATTPADDPLYARTLFARGIPDCRSLRQGLRVNSCDQADRAAVGWMMFLPVVPLDHDILIRSIDIFSTEAERHGTAGMLEFNVTSPHSTNMVVQIPFMRDPDSTHRAHSLRAAARKAFLAAGFPPYRSNIDQAPDEIADRAFGYLDGPLDGLKRLFDPAGVIAPGRYINGADGRRGSK